MSDPTSLYALLAAALSFVGVASLLPSASGTSRKRVTSLRPPAPRAVPTIPHIRYDEEDDVATTPSGSPVALRDVSYDPDALTDEPTALTSVFRLEVAGRTDVGLRRTHNEDRLLVLEDEHVFVVADGMGGHAGGGLASELAVRAIAESVGSVPHAEDSHGGRVPRAAGELITAVGAANDAVRDAADADDRFAEMGTTVVAARFCPKKQRLYVTHVGDSRCYRLRGGKLRQVTLDHTMNALGVTGPTAHHLSRAVGTRDHVEPDVAVLKPELGDAYVLCSDGLTKMVTDEAIGEVIASFVDVEHAADELVRIANERGGKDNVTAIVIRVTSKAAA